MEFRDHHLQPEISEVKWSSRKAVESNQDVAIALLQYRNAPIAGCEYSPAQLLFNRQLRTRIPTLPITDPDPKRSDLQLRQERQKFYHDRRSRPLPPLQPGDAVRVQNGQSWQAAKVIAAHPSLRSYNIETNMGTQLRRNQRDLIRTREDPPVCSVRILSMRTSRLLRHHSSRDRTPARTVCVQRHASRLHRAALSNRQFVFVTISWVPARHSGDQGQG